MARNQTADEKFDRLLGRLARILALVIGLGVFLYEVLVKHEIEFALLGVGIAGLPFGNAMEKLMIWLSELRPPPPEQPGRKNRDD